MLRSLLREPLLHFLVMGLGLDKDDLVIRRSTGRIIALVGLTMAAGVVTWAWSPIKFQADMGVLLAFMFLWNMLGALILVPALGRFLLKTPTVYKPRAGVA